MKYLNPNFIESFEVVIDKINKDYRYYNYIQGVRLTKTFTYVVEKSHYGTGSVHKYHNEYKDYIYIDDESTMKKDNSFLKDKTVVYNPHIIINMINNTKHTIFFENEDKLNEYVETYLKTINTICL